MTQDLVNDPAGKPFETIICIPGNWGNWTEFMLSLVETSGGEYMAAGMVLLNTRTRRGFKIEYCNRDERMQQAFRYAGMVNRVTDDFLEDIDRHTAVIYITGETGNMEGAEHIAFAATAILNTGGIGVKVETTGKAFDKEKWLAFTTSFEPANLYPMFVLDSIMDEDGTTWSCGMHNLGLKDTIVSGEAFQDAVDLISIFGYYQLIDKPTIHDNQTFSASAEAPRFRITEEPEQPNKGDDLFENPFGMWRLTKDN